jgi:hypothetical protein
MAEPIRKFDSNGIYWCLNELYHRENGPAVEYVNGTKEWYLNGKLHREDGPAIDDADGNKYWFLNGLCHREDGPAVEYSNGYKAWWKYEKLHREDGPAIEWPARNQYDWYLNGELIGKGIRPENWDELVVLSQVEKIMND